MTSNLTGSNSWSEGPHADVLTARAVADQQQHAAERIKAARVVAGGARDRQDAAALFGALGLGVPEIRAARGERAALA